jgi:hypothetical protein
MRSNSIIVSQAISHIKSQRIARDLAQILAPLSPAK